MTTAYRNPSGLNHANHTLYVQKWLKIYNIKQIEQMLEVDSDLLELRTSSPRFDFLFELYNLFHPIRIVTVNK